jgi:hypothetical protein
MKAKEYKRLMDLQGDTALWQADDNKLLNSPLGPEPEVGTEAWIKWDVKRKSLKDANDRQNKRVRVSGSEDGIQA